MHFFVHHYPNDEENMTPRQFNSCCPVYPYCKGRLKKAGPQVLPKMQIFSSLPEKPGILLVPPNHKLTLILSFTSSMMLPFDMSFVQGQNNCCMQLRYRIMIGTFGSKQDYKKVQASTQILLYYNNTKLQQYYKSICCTLIQSYLILMLTYAAKISLFFKLLSHKHNLHR